MPKFIEITAPDDFDDDQHTTYDALDRHMAISPVSQVGRHQLEQALLDLDAECQFDVTGTESTEEFADLKRHCRSLVEQIRKEHAQ